MKKLIVVATLIAFASFAPVAKAETVECRSEQYGGAVCGISTSTETVEHKVIATGANDSQMIKLLLSIAGAATLATGLYKLTYRSYILG
jgi:hypothetical protein